MEPDFRDVIAERVPVASERCRLSDVPEEEERVVHHLEKQGQCWSYVCGHIFQVSKLARSSTFITTPPPPPQKFMVRGGGGGGGERAVLRAKPPWDKNFFRTKPDKRGGGGGGGGQSVRTSFEAVLGSNLIAAKTSQEGNLL